MLPKSLSAFLEKNDLFATIANFLGMTGLLSLRKVAKAQREATDTFLITESAESASQTVLTSILAVRSLLGLQPHQHDIIKPLVVLKLNTTRKDLLDTLRNLDRALIKLEEAEEDEEKKTAAKSELTNAFKAANRKMSDLVDFAEPTDKSPPKEWQVFLGQVDERLKEIRSLIELKRKGVE